MTELLLDFQDFLEDKYEIQTYGLFSCVTAKLIKRPENIWRFFSKNIQCPFCHKKMNIVYLKEKSFSLKYDSWYLLKIWECGSCGWWKSQFNTKENLDELWVLERSQTCDQKYGIVKRFDVSDKGLPIKILLRELSKKKDVLYHINPYKLEELTQYVFSSFYNCEVEHVGKSHDGGVDLLIVNSDYPILVQVKRRTNPSYIEPVSTIRDFIGAMYLKNSKKGIIVTTARDFSREAYKSSRNILFHEKFEYFDLINFERFYSMLDVIKKDDLKPWQKIGEMKWFQNE